VDESKPLPVRRSAAAPKSTSRKRSPMSTRLAGLTSRWMMPMSRDLHSFTFELNVSTFYVWVGRLGVCSGGFRAQKGVSGGFQGVFSCQKRLRLSWKVDECKPVPMSCRPPSVKSRLRITLFATPLVRAALQRRTLNSEATFAGGPFYFSFNR